jgi:hypothetical protein
MRRSIQNEAPACMRCRGLARPLELTRLSPNRAGHRGDRRSAFQPPHHWFKAPAESRLPGSPLGPVSSPGCPGSSSEPGPQSPPGCPGASSGPAWELPPSCPGALSRLPGVASGWCPSSLVGKFYCLAALARKRLRQAISRFFSCPQLRPPEGLCCPQNQALSTGPSTVERTRIARGSREGHAGDRRGQKTGMMSSGEMSDDTSTPSMSSSGTAGNSIPQRWTMARILAIAWRQFSACWS